MVARLSTTTVGRGAVVGSEVLTTACVTSIATCPDARSTIGFLLVVTGTDSLMASLAGLPILNGTNLSSDFLHQIFQCRRVIGDSSFVISSFKDSYCPPPCGVVTSTAWGFFLINFLEELDDSLPAAA
ncbi:hypothetical protein R1flu_025523 [Riccia fluitans]|uniref:Uncharacterized protein n=1 Tax=Riccia fluitans TaxID=41844 RepID=A0ABD1Y0Y5_9MARC